MPWEYNRKSLMILTIPPNPSNPWLPQSESGWTQNNGDEEIPPL